MISPIASATAALSSTIGNAIDCDEPTARNSNLLPVNANGDVRLRSVLSFSISGSRATPSLIISCSALAGVLSVGDRVDDLREHAAHEHRDDRRRRFVRAEAMLVARRADAGAQQARVLVHGAQHRREEDEEANVLMRRLARLEQVRCRRAPDCRPRSTSTSCSACPSR